MKCPNCKEEITKQYYTTPVWISLKTLVLNQEDKILVIRRSATDYSRPFSWDLPGGALEEGEDPTAGIIRETKEETGLEIKKLEVIGIVSFAEKDGDQLIMLMFKAKAESEKITLSFEHDQYKWLSKSELLDLDISETYKNFAKKL